MGPAHCQTTRACKILNRPPPPGGTYYCSRGGSPIPKKREEKNLSRRLSIKPYKIANKYSPSTERGRQDLWRTNHSLGWCLAIETRCKIFEHSFGPWARVFRTAWGYRAKGTVGPAGGCTPLKIDKGLARDYFGKKGPEGFPCCFVYFCSAEDLRSLRRKTICQITVDGVPPRSVTLGGALLY